MKRSSSILGNALEKSGEEQVALNPAVMTGSAVRAIDVLGYLQKNSLFMSVNGVFDIDPYKIRGDSSKYGIGVITRVPGTVRGGKTHVAPQIIDGYSGGIVGKLNALFAEPNELDTTEFHAVFPGANFQTPVVIGASTKDKSTQGPGLTTTVTPKALGQTQLRVESDTVRAEADAALQSDIKDGFKPFKLDPTSVRPENPQGKPFVPVKGPHNREILNPDLRTRSTVDPTEGKSSTGQNIRTHTSMLDATRQLGVRSTGQKALTKVFQ